MVKKLLALGEHIVRSFEVLQNVPNDYQIILFARNWIVRDVANMYVC